LTSANPAAFNFETYSSSCSAPATQPTHSSRLLANLDRHLAADDDIGHRETAARLQHAKRLKQDRIFVARQVDDAVSR
jgi:hypothetical protein